MKNKQILTSALALSMILSMATPAFAAESNEVPDPLPGTGSTKITVEVIDKNGNGGGDNPDPDNPNPPTPDVIIATVPVELPIIMDLDGNITVPTDAKIINHHTDKGIKVSSLSVNLGSDWTAADYTDDFTAKADNEKSIGISFRGDTLNSDGTFTVTADNWNIAKDSNLPLNMSAKIPKQTSVWKNNAATVEFSLAWSGLDGTDGGSDPDAGKDNTTPDVPPETAYTVNFITDGNGQVDGDATITVTNGKVTFPNVTPSSIRYEFSKWVNSETNDEITESTVITSDLTIKAVFSERASSPKNWFTTDGASTITGLSDEYLSLIDAPTDLVIPNNIGGSTIKAIGAGAFKNKDLITSIVIPNTVTSIAADSFVGCTSITELNLEFSYTNSILNSPFGIASSKIRWAPLEDWDTDPITSDELLARKLKFNSSNGSIKALNNSISNARIPSSVNGVRVTQIDTNAFELCSLTNVTISDSVTIIGENAFGGNDKLSNVTLGKSIKTIGKLAFTNCTGLTNLVLPDGTTTIKEQAFSFCHGLESITIPDSVKTIEKAAFYGCDSLKSIDIPNGLTTIDLNTFAACTKLSSINLPDSIVNIEGGAFYECKNLSNLVVPDNVSSIGDLAFKDVTHISYKGSATGSPWGAKAVN